MTIKEQETLSQTIRCHLERNENGGIKLVPNPSGPWKIIKMPPTTGLVRYFQPAYEVGIDKYGKPLR